jgi:hypothetical protein
MARLRAVTRRRIQLEYAMRGNTSAIARKFKVTRRTVRRWVSSTYDQNGVEERPGRGRKPALDKASARAAYKMLKSRVYNGAAHVAHKLHIRRPNSATKPVSKSTIIRHAKAYAISVGDEIVCDRRKPIQQLDEACMHTRVQFSKAHNKRDWSNVMFTDRKRFYFMYPGSHVKASVWHSKGQRQTAYRPSAPQCFNLYCGITRYGATACCPVSGTSGKQPKFYTQRGNIARNICSEEYHKVVMKKLLTGGDKIFKEHEVTSWVMQQDNDRCHAAASKLGLDDYLKKNKESEIELLPGWPAHSPDLSPIENFWGSVQIKVNSMGCRSFLAFKRAVMKIIREAPSTWFEHYYETMNDRLKQCIINKGERIKH